MKLSLFGLFCFLSVYVFAQTITHGPVVGGVTDTSCNIFVRTSAPTSFSILLSNTYPFGSIVASGVGTTDSADNIAIMHIGGLTANTQYYMRLTINGSPISVPTTFTTMYVANSIGHQVFITGADISSITDADSAIFKQAASENARAFIQLGNWGYPDVNSCIDIYLTNPPNSWAASYASVQSLYKQRYSNVASTSFIQSLGLDYVYDDHDYINQWSGGTIIMAYQINVFNGIPGAPLSHSQPAQARPNALLGYRHYFPSYNLPDTSNGQYHSFRSGNAEFFVLDTRSARGFELQCIDTQGSASHWRYALDSASHILGNEQMRWLKNGLSQSTATWKFVVSSVPFNMGMRFALDTLIKIGNGSVPYWNPQVTCDPFSLGTHAFSSTNHFADMWAGFKADGDSLLNYVLGNNIPNVFVISGNTGTVGLDDGINSGLPELMSGNMKITNTQDAQKYQNFMGFNIWDLGGSGLCQQQNMNTTFGKIEIFNNDSIRLSAVDQTGAEVTGANFYAGAAYKYSRSYSPFRTPMANDDVVIINENDSSVIIPVTANDSDLNALPLFINLQTNPAHGTATLNNNNTVTYVPDSAFFGIDTFHYRVCDHSNVICANCADAMVRVQISEANAINELQTDIRFNIYPNPAEDVLYVKAVNNSNALRFELFNTLGQQLQVMDFTGNTIVNMAQYPAGNYFYGIRDKASRLLKVGKIMVMR